MSTSRKQKSAPGRQKSRKRKPSGYSSFLAKYLHIIAAVLVISGVAGIGYYFQFVHAAPDFIYVDECGRWHDPGNIWSDCDVSRDYPAGQTISVPVYGNTLIADYFGLPTRPNQLHAQVTLYHYDSPLTYGGYTCGAGNTCSSGIRDSVYTGPDSGDDGTICVQINSSSIGQKKYPLFTVRYPSMRVRGQATKMAHTKLMVMCIGGRGTAIRQETAQIVATLGLGLVCAKAHTC